MPGKHFARICWNSRGWTSPTGEAKRLKQGRYPTEKGFGHEEWLFRPGWTIDEYHYGFVEGLRFSHERLAGRAIELMLWTIDDVKRRWYVGRISDCDVLTTEEATRAVAMYSENAWLDAMRAEISACGGDPAALDGAPPTELLNLRYRPTSFEAMRQAVPVGDRVLKFRSAWIAEARADEFTVMAQRRTTGRARRRPEASSQRRAIDPTTIDYFHNRIQNRIYDLLVARHTDACVSMEDDRVDIVVDAPETRIFVEVKSMRCPRLAIREAVGQLLEYALYPPRDRDPVPRLVVAAPGRVEQADETFLAALSAQIGLSIEYVQATPEMTTLPF